MTNGKAKERKHRKESRRQVRAMRYAGNIIELADARTQKAEKDRDDAIKALENHRAENSDEQILKVTDKAEQMLINATANLMTSHKNDLAAQAATYEERIKAMLAEWDKERARQIEIDAMNLKKEEE